MFEVLFFAVVNICLLNIVFGIMVDTFSQLREQHQERGNIINNTCLICGKHRPEFTKGAHKMGFFQEHIKHEHNVFEYLAFITFIRLND